MQTWAGRRFDYCQKSFIMSKVSVCLPDWQISWRYFKGAITSKIKHAMKLNTSPARLEQLLQPSLAFCFSLQPMTACCPILNGLQQLCKFCRTCFMFYCMFYFTCDRSLKHGRVTTIGRLSVRRFWPRNFWSWPMKSERRNLTQSLNICVKLHESGLVTCC